MNTIDGDRKGNIKRAEVEGIIKKMHLDVQSASLHETEKVRDWIVQEDKDKISISEVMQKTTYSLRGVATGVYRSLACLVNIIIARQGMLY